MPKGTSWIEQNLYSFFAFSCIRKIVFSGFKIKICDEIPFLFHVVNE